MNTLFDMDQDKQDRQAYLFSNILLEQNAEDVVTAYTDYGLQVTINIRMARHHEIGFARNMRRVVGVKDCQIDTTIKAVSENTSFIVTFQDKPGIVHKLPEIRQ